MAKLYTIEFNSTLNASLNNEEFTHDVLWVFEQAALTSGDQNESPIKR